MQIQNINVFISLQCDTVEITILRFLVTLTAIAVQYSLPINEENT
jgi:hypothetical protein